MRNWRWLISDILWIYCRKFISIVRKCVKIVNYQYLILFGKACISILLHFLRKYSSVTSNSWMFVKISMSKVVKLFDKHKISLKRLKIKLRSYNRRSLWYKIKLRKLCVICRFNVKMHSRLIFLYILKMNKPRKLLNNQEF